MKTTAKFLSLFLCLAMIFSVGLAIIVNAANVEAPSVEVPSLSVKVIKTESVFGEPLYNKVTVAVYLESGSLNTFEFNFKTKNAVCQSISEGSHSGSVLFSSQVNPPSDRSQVAMISTNLQAKNGKSEQLVVAEFKTLKGLESTINLDIKVCEVTDSNYDNIPVKPKIISTVKITTTTTTKKTTTTKTTTTTKKPAPVNPTPSNSSSGSGSSGGSGNQGGNSIPVYTGAIPGGAITSGDLTVTDNSSTDISETPSEDTSLDYDVYASEYFDSTQESETQQAAASLDEVMEDSHSNKKVIIIVAIIAALIIAGAVTAVLLIKKRNKGAANEL